jgi:hypothetical protein
VRQNALSSALCKLLIETFFWSVHSFELYKISSRNFLRKNLQFSFGFFFENKPNPEKDLKSIFHFTISLSEGIFHDLLWRLKRLNTDKAGNLAVVCADVMFNFQAPYIKDEALVSFAAKHDIKKMVMSDGTVKWYGCRRGLIYTKDAKCSWPNGIGAPPCDLWNLGEVVRFVMQACEEGGMHCEYAAGNVLGKIYRTVQDI